MRNEGPFLLEWLAHHRALGVTDFLVYSNECDDGTADLLDRLQDAGELAHVRHAPRGKSVQWQALKAAKAHPLLRAADWCLSIDCDEFVNLRAPLLTLADLIAARPDADAFVLPWRLFGAGGHLGFADEPVTQRFTRATPEDILFPASSRFFKTLFRWRDGPFARFGVHRPKTKGTAKSPPVWVDGSGRKLPADFAGDDNRILLLTRRIETGLVQLNHYSLRSAEDFIAKRARGLPNRSGKAIDASYWAERNFNSVEDRSIVRHAPATETERSRLLALPGVATAHEAAVSLHRAKIRDLLSRRDGASLFSRLALLPGSEPPDRGLAERLLRLVHRARGDDDPT